MKVEIKETRLLWQGGIDKGKPSGDINYDVLIDGKERGKIFAPSNSPKRFQVMSKSILGEYKAKYFKTFDGAKRFLVNSKVKFVSLAEAIKGMK